MTVDFSSFGSTFVGKCHLLLTFAFSVLLFASQTQGKMCTSLRAVQKTVPAMCTESYQARCGWFTLKMCTFYEKVPCTGERNSTKVTQYKIVTECCSGYKYDKDRINCIPEVPVEKGDPAAVKDPDVVDEDEEFEFSHGAFAAIACAGLFIICVTIVIIIHVRKKQLKKEKDAKKESGHPVELQKMVQA